MGQYNQAVLTTAGQALLTSILGNAGTLTFSKFQTSSYQYASGTDLSALTSLQSVEQNVVPSAGGIKDATTFYSSSTVPNTGVTVEYTNYTVGLFATDGDDEVLFAVSTAIVPDIIPVDDGGAPSTYTYTMSIGVSSTANITVEVDDQGILRVSSIVDNLNSTSATQPLSANMGRFLNDKVNYYGVCSTAAGTTAKTASTANGDFTLETGARIVIKFANGSTVDSPTLNIDSTGAKAIYLNGAALDMDFEAGGCYLFVYNGTQFDLLGGGGTVTTVNVSYIGATIDAAIPQGTIVYYLKQKLYKIARDLSGETFPYTIVPATDFEASGLNGTELLLVDGIPGSGINALDVAFDNTGTGMSAGNVQGAITELNSNLGLLELSSFTNNVSFTIQLESCTGTVYNEMSVRSNDKYLLVTGAVMVGGFSRTGGNPGFVINLPFNIKSQNIGNCGLAAGDNNISLIERLRALANNNTIAITRSESYSNLTGNTVVFNVMPIILAR